jgi:hypothetical protein
MRFEVSYILYSGIFQVIWMAHSVPVTINMHCSRLGFDLFTKPVTVLSAQHAIDILWVDLHNDQRTVPNHIVPLLPVNGNVYYFTLLVPMSNGNP